MSVLVTADLHLSANPRDAYRHDFQKQLRKLVKQHAVDCVLILGDLTELKDNHGAELVNRTVDHFYRLRRLCEVGIIKGNHDYEHEAHPFFEFVKRLGIYWYNDPCDVPDLMPKAVAELGKVLLMPHARGLTRSPSTKKNYDFVFTHLTFNGAKDGKQVLKGVPCDLFGQGPVYSGDIHTPQKLGNVTYVGSPYTIDFGDRFDPRVLLFEDGKVTSIPVKGKQKRLVELTSLAELEPGSVPIRYVAEGDIIKVKYLITPENRANWQNIQAKIREWGERKGLLVHTIQPVMLEKLRRQPKRKKVVTKSDEAMVTAYGKHRKLDEKTLKVGINLTRKH